MFHSLRYRLTAIFIGLAIGPLILVAIAIEYRSFSSLEQQSLTLQRELATRVGDELQTFIEERTRELVLLNGLENLASLPPNRQGAALGILLSRQQIYQSLVLVDIKGQEWAAVSRHDGTGGAQVRQWAEEEAFLFPLTQGEFYYSPVSFDENTHEPMMLVSIPVTDLRSGAITFVLVANLKLKPIWDLLSHTELSSASDVYVTDRAGHVLAHRNPSVVLRGTMADIPARDGRATGLTGNKVFAVKKVLHFGQQEFVIIAEQPVSVALELANETLRMTVIATLVALGTVGLLVIFSVRHLVRPIEHVAHLAQAIGRGDFSRQIHVSTRDEVYELAVTFNSMSRRLQESMSGLQQEIAERVQAQEALTVNVQTAIEFQDRLKALHDVDIELSQETSLDDLYRRAIELGRSRLGFDRLGLFLISEDGKLMLGTFGTNKEGDVIDERELVNEIANDPYISQAIQSKSPVTIWSDKKLMNNWQEVGSGWGLMAALWDGDRTIGWLAADNLVRQEPLAAYQPELLTLFGSTLGHLVKQLQAGEALRERELKYRALFQQTTDAVFLSDLDGNHIDVNQRAADMLGYTVEELVGLSFREIVAPSDRANSANVLNALQARQKIAPHERMLRTRDGVEFPVEISVELVEDEDGNPLHIQRIVRDITTRKRDEEHRITLAFEKEQMRLLTDFITAVSHEFRTPLSIINTRLYLIERAGNPGDRAVMAAVIKEQVTYIGELFEAMITMTRLGGGSVTMNMRPLDVNTLLRSIEVQTSTLVQAKQQSLALRLAPDLPPVHGDEKHLYSALLQFVENGIRFTPEQGTITIQTAAVEDGVVVTVTDTGIGIAAEHLDHIFDHFFRVDAARTERGAGMGLPIAQRIIDIHQGRIEVDSEPETGSTFRIFLPTHPDGRTTD